MKITKIFLLVCLAASLSFQGCKYEEGPMLSLSSKKNRAVNKWVIDKVYEKGVDKTEEYKRFFVNYSIELKSDKNYVLKYRPFNLSDYEEKGTWDFSGDKKQIIFKPIDQSSGSIWNILRLKSNEAWVTQMVDGEELELHMKD